MGWGSGFFACVLFCPVSNPLGFRGAGHLGRVGRGALNAGRPSLLDLQSLGRSGQEDWLQSFSWASRGLPAATRWVSPSWLLRVVWSDVKP